MSAARGQALLASGSLLVCTALLSISASPALAQRNSRSDRPANTVPREVKKLWSEYPLDPRRSPEAPSQTSTTDRGGARGPSAADEGGDPAARRILWPAALALAGFLSILTLAVFLGLRPAWAAGRPRTLPRPRFRVPRALFGDFGTNAFPRRLFESGRKRRRARLPDVVAVSTSAAASSAARQDLFAPHSIRGAGRSETLSQSEHRRPGTDTGEAVRGPVEAERIEVGLAEEGYTQVGEHVTAVLTSAQQAAEEIRQSARKEAELIRAEANEEAAATVAEATLEAEQRRRESDEVRAEADRYGEETRKAADRYLEQTRRESHEEAARRRADVDQQVREIRLAAERRAKDLETEAHERQKALVLEAERSEARLEQLLGVFRGMTLQLEELVEQAEPSGQAERDAAPAAGSLNEALEPRRSPSRSG
jgi:cell division septum initiation protein DivIVA